MAFANLLNKIEFGIKRDLLISYKCDMTKIMSLKHNIYSKNPEAPSYVIDVIEELNNDNSKKNHYVLKLFPSKYVRDDCINEAFVGLLGTNTLNSPFFAKILAMDYDTPCGKPYYHTEELCTFVVYEYISGMTLYDYIFTASLDELKRIFKQIFLALYEANTKIGFTHYDLHCKNVVIRESDKLPVIIDYGLSHIKYNGENHGIYLQPYAFNRDIWQCDVIKLITCTLWQIFYYDIKIATAKYEMNECVVADEILDYENDITEINQAASVITPDMKAFVEPLQKLMYFFDSGTIFDAEYIRYERIREEALSVPEQYINGNYDFTQFIEYMQKIL